MSGEMENKIEQAENQPAGEITEQSDSQPAGEITEQSDRQPAGEITEQSDNQPEKDKNKNPKWKKFLIAAGVLALVVAGVVYGYSQTPG